MTRPATPRALPRFTALAAAAAAATLLAGCGSGGTATGAAAGTASTRPPAPGSASPTPPAGTGPPTGPAADRLVVRIDEVGGLIAPAARLGVPPAASVYGDGRLLFAAPDPERDPYPGRALVPVGVRTLSAGEVTRLLADARAAGLDGQRRDYGPPHVMDVPDTVFTLDDGGRTVRVVVHGLTEETGSAGPGTAAQRSARARLAAFRDEVMALTRPPAGTVRPTRLVVFALRYRAPGGAGEPRAWRGPDPAAGRPVPELGEGLRCSVLRGRTLARVLPDVEAATRLTRWTAGGREWRLVFRPLLPDESSCADVTRTLRPDDPA